ncbi:hypothetical protein HDU81_010688, partial [Chytriomyces hyalinus]
RELYKLARSMMGGRLIIDVGSGRLQSHQIFDDSNATYLFCDPNLKIPRDKKYNNWTDLTHYDMVSILNVIVKMNRGSLKRAYYIGAIHDLLSNREIHNYIIKKSIPLTYSMSLSHVPAEFSYMSMQKAKQVGCRYLYDDVDHSGTLVNLGGISMRLDDAADSPGAVVKFPKSEPYTEVPITTNSLKGCKIIHLSVYTPEYSTLAHDVKSVCRHIYMAVSE